MYQRIELPARTEFPPVPLAEHNKRRIDMRDRDLGMRFKAGVACDKCGTEMVYPDLVVYPTEPPKREVVCPKCNHRGYKFV